MPDPMAPDVEARVCNCETPDDAYHGDGCPSQLRVREPGMRDEWWPSSSDGDLPVNAVVLGIAHHHATGHVGGGAGDGGYDCEECTFAVDDAGMVESGGWVRWKS